MKKMSSFIGLVLASTSLFASDDGAAVFAAGLIGFMALIWIAVAVVTVFFILAQNKLIDTAELNDPDLHTGKVWTWTQLIPVWSYAAQAVTIVKLTEQYKRFVDENNIEAYQIAEYKPIWGWLLLGFGAASMVMPFLGVFALVFLILYWMNIYSSTESIKKYKLLMNNN